MARKQGFNDFRIEGDVAHMVITDRAGNPKCEVLLDIPDLRRLEAEGARWSVSGSPSRKVSYCVRKFPSGLTIKLHRYLMGDNEGKVIDHINRNTMDCRRSNMRACDQADNARNLSPRTNTLTGVRGLHAQKSNRFPYRVSLGSGGTIFALKVRTLNIGRITASLARAQHWGAEAA